ncbi:hypothetical protein [Flavobacterium psychrophilum]|uniref:hypothetical protein n=1 Tax=Flavobacterium psychrophilum TaxID=96345 RepID=UPI00061877C9|nr:hypothetical protein [Flavobacterium psychrophilum]OAE90301.1 hypothetical protein SU65_11170 [Flavobacterium psychrophilum]
MQDLIKNILSDVSKDLNGEFLQGFDDKNFFGSPWPKSTKGLTDTGKLRRSVFVPGPKIQGNQIIWSSSLPYASIHNQGGEIIVTEKMKRFFWAMFYKSSNAILFNVRSKAAAKTERNRRLSAEALMWKNLALQKVGAKMKIKQRQFIGDHPQVRQRIEHVVNKNMEEIGKTIFNKFKQ